MRSRAGALLVLLLLFLIGVSGAAERPADAAPPLTLESLRIDPATPGVDTLCHLAVTVRNAGTRRVSALVFRVRVGGKELPVYGKEVFLPVIEPGATAEVRLHNFWTTETGRPAPANGRLDVEVALVEARWLDVQTRDGAEVRVLGDPVAGLPSPRSTRSATVPVRR
jgi:hypothetical protein